MIIPKTDFNDVLLIMDFLLFESYMKYFVHLDYQTTNTEAIIYFCVIKYFIFVYSCINLLLIYSSKDSWSTDSKKWSPCYSSPSPALWSHQISLKSSSLTTVTTVIRSLPDANPCQSRGYKWIRIWHKTWQHQLHSVLKCDNIYCIRPSETDQHQLHSVLRCDNIDYMQSSVTDQHQMHFILRRDNIDYIQSRISISCIRSSDVATSATCSHQWRICYSCIRSSDGATSTTSNPL